MVGDQQVDIGIWAEGRIAISRPGEGRTLEENHRHPAKSEGAEHLIDGREVRALAEGGAHVVAAQHRAARGGNERSEGIAGKMPVEQPGHPMSPGFAGEPVPVDLAGQKMLQTREEGGGQILPRGGDEDALDRIGLRRGGAHKRGSAARTAVKLRRRCMERWSARRSPLVAEPEDRDALPPCRR